MTPTRFALLVAICAGLGACASTRPVAPVDPPAQDDTPPPVGALDGTHELEGRSADYAMYVASGEGTYQVAVVLPGDGWPASDLIDDPLLRSWADDVHGIVVSLDPPAPPSSGCWWTPNKHRRAEFLLDFLNEKVLGIYDIDMQKVDLGGWSGGAFLAFGAPFYVDLPFSGGLVGVCGGDIPRIDTDTDFCGDDLSDDPPSAVDATRAAELAQGRRVYVARTSGDELVTAIDGGLAFWEQHGATTRLVDKGPGGHCDFEVTESIVEGLLWLDEGR